MGRSRSSPAGDRSAGDDVPRHIAEEVRDFYERYPYPRPVESLDRYRQLWTDRTRRRADFHLFWPSRAYREDFSILVAGCGTSQAARHAARWPAASVTGIDVSMTSVRCTETLKQKHNLRNLHVHRLPIERAGELGTSFDQIVCTGVLHHLAAPDTGLASLCDVLKPDGAMHLMVYAPYGRTGVYMLQDFHRRLGLCATDPDIRDLMSALRMLPNGHPLQTLLQNAPDFSDAASVADALLHPQDRAYSIPQLFEFVEEAHLTFGRWIRQAPYSPHCGLVARLPLASRLTRLSPPEQYAAVELFRGTMVRHSLIAYRDADAIRGVRFTDESWRDYVPIRMPDTTCVQERVPPGAAAVLINRAHTDRDLVLPISAQEKRWFDSIDGTRSIGEIGGTGAFFERLWWHDQVVFDTSCCCLPSAAESAETAIAGAPCPTVGIR